MSPQDALVYVAQICANALLTRQQHIQAEQALQVLAQAIQPPPAEPEK